MRWECRERFPRHRLQRKPQVSDPGMHLGTCMTHVPRCMSGLLTSFGGENVPGIPAACATRNFTYLARGPLNYTDDSDQRNRHKMYHAHEPWHFQPLLSNRFSGKRREYLWDCLSNGNDLNCITCVNAPAVLAILLHALDRFGSLRLQENPCQFARHLFAAVNL